MSRTTIPITHRPAISRAVLLALLLAVTATVIWQVAPPAGTDGTSVGRRAGSVESAPIAPLRQLERAEQVRTATLRNGRPERRLAPTTKRAGGVPQRAASGQQSSDGADPRARPADRPAGAAGGTEGQQAG